MSGKAMSAKPTSSKKQTVQVTEKVAKAAKPAKAAKETAKVVVAAPVPEVVAKKGGRKAKAPEVAAPAPVVASAPVAEAAPAKEVSKSDESLVALALQVSQLIESARKLQSELKSTKVTVSRELKEAKKSKGKARDPNKKKRNPTGFAVPTQLSDELCTFLGLAKKTVMPRTVVTTRITEYVKSHNLAEGRNIKADAALTKLLGLKATDDPLTYFNLQSFLKHHYTKPAVAAAPAK